MGRGPCGTGIYDPPPCIAAGSRVSKSLNISIRRDASSLTSRRRGIDSMPDIALALSRQPQLDAARVARVLDLVDETGLPKPTDQFGRGMRCNEKLFC